MGRIVNRFTGRPVRHRIGVGGPYKIRDTVFESVGRKVREYILTRTRVNIPRNLLTRIYSQDADHREKIGAWLIGRNVILAAVNRLLDHIFRNISLSQPYRHYPASVLEFDRLSFWPIRRRPKLICYFMAAGRIKAATKKMG